MYKKFLALGMSCIMTLSAIPFSYAAELEEAENGATMNYIITQLNELTGKDNELLKDDTEATVEDFLHEFASMTGKRYIRYNGERFVYSSGDSMWMSEEEWNELIQNYNEVISIDTVDKIIDQTYASNDFIKTHHIPDTYERFKDMIDGFYGEFSDIIDEYPNSTKYWVNKSCETGFYDPTDFAAIIHELLHEISARKSDSFVARGEDSRGWYVRTDSNPSQMFIYNVPEQEWVEFDAIKVPMSNYLIDEVPEAVKESKWYKTYLTGETSSNTKGIWGIMQELQSSVATLRTDVISGSIQYHFDELLDERIADFYFWHGTILHYLSGLKENNPETYEKLINNDDFIDVVYELLNYGKSQTWELGVKILEDETCIAIKSWAKDDEAIAQFNEIASIYYANKEAEKNTTQAVENAA